MTQERIDRLLFLLDELVNEQGPTWQEKRQSILAIANEQDRIDLEEFASWFTEGE